MPESTSSCLKWKQSFATRSNCSKQKPAGAGTKQHKRRTFTQALRCSLNTCHSDHTCLMVASGGTRNYFGSNPDVLHSFFKKHLRKDCVFKTRHLAKDCTTRQTETENVAWFDSFEPRSSTTHQKPVSSTPQANTTWNIIQFVQLLLDVDTSSLFSGLVVNVTSLTSVQRT